MTRSHKSRCHETFGQGQCHLATANEADLLLQLVDGVGGGFHDGLVVVNDGDGGWGVVVAGGGAAVGVGGSSEGRMGGR